MGFLLFVAVRTTSIPALKRFIGGYHEGWLGVIVEEFLQSDPGPLEDLGESGPLQLARMMRNREVNRPIGRVGEVVVTAYDMVQQVSRVLKGPNDLPRPEGRHAGGHVTLNADGHACSDGAHPAPSFPGNRLAVLSEHR